MIYAVDSSTSSNRSSCVRPPGLSTLSLNPGKALMVSAVINAKAVGKAREDATSVSRGEHENASGSRKAPLHSATVGDN